MKTSTKVWIFLVGISLLILFFAYEWLGRWGLLISFLSLMASNSLIFYFGESLILKKLNAKKCIGQDPWGLLDKIQFLSNQLDCEPPDLFVIEKNSASIFSVFRPWKKPALCFTEGLLKKLTPNEIDAVITYQLVHMQNFQSFAFSILNVVSNSLLESARFIDEKFRLPKIFEWIVSPISQLLIRIYVSPKMFLKTDENTAMLIANRKDLAMAIWKLSCLGQTVPLSAPTGTDHLFMISPDNNENQIHPKLEERLKNLIGYYPI